MDRIIWSPTAVADLAEIYEYISRDSQNYAAELLEELMLAPRRFQKFPRIGRIVPEYEIENLRELIIGSYRMVYELMPNTVQIIGIIHGRRDLKSALQPED